MGWDMNEKKERGLSGQKWQKVIGDIGDLDETKKGMFRAYSLMGVSSSIHLDIADIPV